jgi:hypothetical protein
MSALDASYEGDGKDADALQNAINIHPTSPQRRFHPKSSVTAPTLKVSSMRQTTCHVSCLQRMLDKKRLNRKEGEQSL